MACIQHYIRDAENIFGEIEARQKCAQLNASNEYRAARTIQRWFRGYITRKHIKYLNKCATAIQRHWRGYVARMFYFKLLQDSVNKMYWNHYKLMATRIQKVWRGHYVRTKVFSYCKLKQFINGVLEKNREFQKQAKRYEEYTERDRTNKMQQECQDWLQYLSFRMHHLIRTHQIEGVLSIHNSFEYSRLEKLLKNIKFTDYMKIKNAKEKEEGVLAIPEENLIFTELRLSRIVMEKIHSITKNDMIKGRMRDCEKAWLHRNDPGKYSLATGEFGQDYKEYKEQERMKEKLAMVQMKPMSFGQVRHKILGDKLGITKYECPPRHRSVK